MPARAENHDREMGSFEATLAAFSSTLEDIKRSNEVAHQSETRRSEEFFRLHKEATEAIMKTDSNVSRLTETVRLSNIANDKALKAHEELVESKFKSIWRWTRIGGGSGAAAMLATAVERIFGNHHP